MGERTKAAGRVLTVVAGTVAALVAGPFVADPLLRHSPVIASLVSLVTFLLLTSLIVKIVYRRRPIDRGLVVLGGYAGACLAAGFVLLLVYSVAYGSRTSPPLDWFPDSVREVAAMLGFFYMATIMASIYVGILALLPTLGIVIYAERNSVRSPLFYGVAGAVSALIAFGIYVAVFLLAGAPRELFRASMLLDGLLLFVAPGLVGGVTYWLIAGRMAGKPRMFIGAERAG